MHCPSCGFDNPEGMKFCTDCGALLRNRCANCAFDNPPQAKFCGECGSPLTTQSHPPVSSSKFQVSSGRPLAPDPQSPASYTPPHLAARLRAEQAALEARGAADGERKTVTALFADIKGSMSLMEDLDPEEARALVDPALQRMMDAVHRYEGYVVQSTGDGIFALFGAPLAHEDHPQRALYAALRMQEEMIQYADTLRMRGRAPIEIRVGVNTGEMVLRSIHKDDLHSDYTPIGHATGLAARMEGLARAGSIVVSENTYKLTEGYFEFKPLGAARVKGASDPISVYEVVGVGALRTRLQVAARRGLSRFIGRQSELEQMKKALAQAQAGHGQIVAVMGEPGIGKSRLCQEFRLIAQPGCLVLEAFSVSHGKAYAYLPLIELLKNYFQLAVQDDERKRREKIGGKVLMLDRGLEDILPYLFHLLGIAEPNSSLQQMDPQIRKRRTLEAIKRVLMRESVNQPLFVIFEDLHWLDAETQDFLNLFGESLATAKIVLLVNYRPEYRHDWSGKTYFSQLRLDPLGQAEAEELLAALLVEKGGGLPESSLQPLKRFILEKTEGNPFFMEEIVQALSEQGVLVRDPHVGAALRGRPQEGTHPSTTLRTGSGVPLQVNPITDLHLPTTVQGILAARIDRLPPDEKTLLQTLAVLGKEFPWSLVAQVAETPEDELHELLSHLQTAEFIYEQPAFPEVEYIFKHALTQEVAYNSLLIERRKVLHERTARALETLFPSRLEDHYGALAHHYSRSGNTWKAIEYLKRAGDQAAQRSADVEAVRHFNSALDLLQTLPDTPERKRQELTLQTALGPVLMATQGWSSMEAEKIYTRARELCREIGETPQLFPILRGLCSFHIIRADLPAARELTRQLLDLANKTQDSGLLLEAYLTSGAGSFWSGEFVSARAHLQQGLNLYDPRRHGHHTVLYGRDSKIFGLDYLARTLLVLGYPEQALQKSQEVLVAAQELNHSFSLAWALSNGAHYQELCREWQKAYERAEAAIVFTTECGFLPWVILATTVRGSALIGQGRQDEGVAQICQGMAASSATGAKIMRTHSLVRLAEAYGRMGKGEEGRVLLDDELAEVRQTEGRWEEAELYRVKGELTLQQLSVASNQLSVTDPRPLAPDPQAEAEAYFHKAIEIARRQQAKLWELRAVVSLSRLWRSQGKKDEARQMLTEIYGWFTEGFDTVDLREAEALLEDLSSC